MPLNSGPGWAPCRVLSLKAMSVGVLVCYLMVNRHNLPGLINRMERAGHIRDGPVDEPNVAP